MCEIFSQLLKNIFLRNLNLLNKFWGVYHPPPLKMAPLATPPFFPLNLPNLYCTNSQLVKSNNNNNNNDNNYDDDDDDDNNNKALMTFDLG